MNKLYKRSCATIYTEREREWKIHRILCMRRCGKEENTPWLQTTTREERKKKKRSLSLGIYKKFFVGKISRWERETNLHSVSRRRDDTTTDAFIYIHIYTCCWSTFDAVARKSSIYIILLDLLGLARERASCILSAIHLANESAGQESERESGLFYIYIK